MLALVVVVLLLSCSQKETAMMKNQSQNQTVPVNTSVQYTLFPCAQVNGTWTFRLEYPDVTIEREFKTEDVCRDNLQAFSTTSRGELEHCYAANVSDDCLTHTAIKMHDKMVCGFHGDSEKRHTCENKVEELK